MADMIPVGQTPRSLALDTVYNWYIRTGLTVGGFREHLEPRKDT